MPAEAAARGGRTAQPGLSTRRAPRRPGLARRRRLGRRDSPAGGGPPGPSGPAAVNTACLDWEGAQAFGPTSNCYITGWGHTQCE